jgi:nitrogen fixation NifU-like protein
LFIPTLFNENGTVMNDALILYQDEILKYGRSPRNFGPLPGATLELNGDSPICGDHMTLSLRIEDEHIEEAKFSSAACCAVCLASSSMMTDAIKGLSVTEAKTLIRTFLRMVNEGGAVPASGPVMGQLMVFQRIRDVPSRSECAALAWNTLDAGLATLGSPPVAARRDTATAPSDAARSFLIQEATS